MHALNVVTPVVCAISMLLARISVAHSFRYLSPEGAVKIVPFTRGQPAISVAIPTMEVTVAVDGR